VATVAGRTIPAPRKLSSPPEPSKIISIHEPGQPVAAKKERRRTREQASPKLSFSFAGGSLIQARALAASAATATLTPPHDPLTRGTARARDT